MAMYHVSIKVAKKDSSRSPRASTHYAYVSRLGRYEKRSRTNEEIVHVKSGNLPSWAKDDASSFWLASDIFERKNGSVYRELEAALPRELSHQIHCEIIDNFIDQVLGTQHPYSLAIHSKKAVDGLPQPHVHLMWSERQMDGIERGPALFFKRAATVRGGKNQCEKRAADASTGGCKKISMYPKLRYFRAIWADLVNAAYADARLKHRVSHLSLRDQDIDRDPEPYLGPILMRGEGGKALLELRKAYRKAAEVEAKALALIERFNKMRALRDRYQILFEPDFLKKNLGKNINKVHVFGGVLADVLTVDDEDSPNQSLNHGKALPRHR